MFLYRPLSHNIALRTSHFSLLTPHSSLLSTARFQVRWRQPGADLAQRRILSHEPAHHRHLPDGEPGPSAWGVGAGRVGQPLKRAGRGRAGRPLHVGGQARQLAHHQPCVSHCVGGQTPRRAGVCGWCVWGEWGGSFAAHWCLFRSACPASALGRPGRAESHDESHTRAV